VTAIKDFGIQLQVKYFFGAEDLVVVNHGFSSLTLLVAPS
jgi:hypothetical protein